ncbi:MAG: family 1 glycosylhydrolase [Dehalococcoidia bacterium]|nr:family 1 glycosylhydrolase [Dehalococcoidia bacterium]
MPLLTFPDGFQWGAATAAYQIEGAHREDDRPACPSGIPSPTSPALSRTALRVMSPATITTACRKTWTSWLASASRHTVSRSRGRG